MVREPESKAVPVGAEIRDRSVRELFERFVEGALALSSAVRLEDGGVELRLTYEGEFLCRAVPYRELFHIQVGDDPAWETRVRTPEAFVAAFDRTVERFLYLCAAKANSPTGGT